MKNPLKVNFHSKAKWNGSERNGWNHFFLRTGTAKIKKTKEWLAYSQTNLSNFFVPFHFAFEWKFSFKVYLFPPKSKTNEKQKLERNGTWEILKLNKLTPLFFFFVSVWKVKMISPFSSERIGTENLSTNHIPEITIVCSDPFQFAFEWKFTFRSSPHYRVITSDSNCVFANFRFELRMISSSLKLVVDC